ncbi:hypothetical protein EVAR_43565_1 [Eumeta japonica]|uniref:Uncharacterized protein n=1 Tax=Eumeta variegata TaxID=151549 RepID=A0A4C1XDX0_EUMVA|nr:hypothetical protein EVAR_43565_1 [Eumeta japonica]
MYKVEEKLSHYIAFIAGFERGDRIKKFRNENKTQHPSLRLPWSSAERSLNVYVYGTTVRSSHGSRRAAPESDKYKQRVLVQGAQRAGAPASLIVRCEGPAPPDAAAAAGHVTVLYYKTHLTKLRSSPNKVTMDSESVGRDVVCPSAPDVKHTSRSLPDSPSDLVAAYCSCRADTVRTRRHYFTRVLNDTEIAECLADSIETQCSHASPPHDIAHINLIEEEVLHKTFPEPKDDLPPVSLSEVQTL